MTPETFLGFPSADPASLEADVAIVGIPHGVSYPARDMATACADAPAAIRRSSARLTRFVGNHDFDLGGPMLDAGAAGRSLQVVDCGDVSGSPEDGPRNLARAEAVIGGIVGHGAIPIALGGDDSVPPPVLRGLGTVHRRVTVLQVDAHLDFRDEVAGVRDGYSSPMRRAAEMAHVERIVQVGLRGIGSARSEDVEAARERGNLLVTATELRRHGVDWLLEQLPAGDALFVSFDLDGLDPAVCPAVSAPSPGGLSYDQAGDLLAGAARRCSLVGATFTELDPTRDRDGVSALVAVRLVSVLIGALARAARLQGQ
jgi:agmatinase